MIDIKRAIEIREILLDSGWRRGEGFLADDFDLVDDEGNERNAMVIAAGMDTAATLDNILAFVRKHRGILVLAFLVLQTGCVATRAWEPLYGPHNLTTMKNHEWDIERRNIYSDGWNDRSEALKKYGE